MKRILLFAGAFLICTLATAGGLSAYFTDRATARASFDLVKSEDAELLETDFSEEEASGIMPGATVKKNPQVGNLSKEDRYVFCEITVPTVNSKGVARPVLSYNPTADWSLLRSYDEGSSRKEVFCYGAGAPKVLAPNQTTNPLFTEVSFQSISGNDGVKKEAVYVGVKMFTVSKKALDSKTKDRTMDKLWERVKSDEKEAYVDVLSKDNKFVIGEFSFDASIVDDELVITNTGDAPAIYFIETNDGQLIPIDRIVNPGETVRIPLSELGLPPGVRDFRIRGIQSDNLKDENGEPIDTSGGLTPELLEKIKNLLNNGEGFYTDDKEIKNPNLTEPEDDIEIYEVFENDKPLGVGSNIYVKEVSIKNTSPYGEKVKVYLDFSDADIMAKSQLSTNGGTTFFPAANLKDNLPAGWSAVTEPDGLTVFVYDKVLEPKESTTRLITNVRTDFSTQEEVKDFDIYIYSSSERRV